MTPTLRQFYRRGGVVKLKEVRNPLWFTSCYHTFKARPLIRMACSMCHAYLHDHFESSAGLAFKHYTTRVAYSSLFQDILQELTNAYSKCMYHQEFYDILLQQITSMEEFSGHEYTLNTFYTTQPLMNNLLSYLEIRLFEAGVGKVAEIREWLSEIIYQLFREIGTVHKNHTHVLAPKNLGAPSLYKPPSCLQCCGMSDTKSVVGEKDELYD